MSVWFTMIIVLVVVVFLSCVWMSLAELKKVLAIYVSKVLLSFVGGVKVWLYNCIMFAFSMS